MNERIDRNSAAGFLAPRQARLAAAADDVVATACSAGALQICFGTSRSATTAAPSP